MEKKLNIGTCSWKYDSWQGLIYPDKKPFNYLKEYSKHYNCVEVDQWFWSLFPGDKVVLPSPAVIQEYADSVPQDFRFGVKVPNSITLTHHYKKKKTDPLLPNPHFLSSELMLRFLEQLKPLHDKLGPLMFQFEYLNKQKMPGGLPQFEKKVGSFVESLPGGFDYCLESRNPNFLNKSYFDFLKNQDLHHVFLQGYYMPSIFDLYKMHRELVKDMAVIRLHGPDRQGIEKVTGKDWSQVVAPKDDDISTLAKMLPYMESRDVQTFTFVNNHFEGSAPRTIERIRQTMQ
jgi:uncharacterized protein YecE (DUF72 family)